MVGNNKSLLIYNSGGSDLHSEARALNNVYKKAVEFDYDFTFNGSGFRWSIQLIKKKKTDDDKK